jgi:hypothetical protein
MALKNVVASLGNGEYQITFPQPIKFDMNFFLQAGTHKIRVLSPDDRSEMAIGVEGEREILLSWLQSVGVDQDNLKSYEEAMTE